MHSHEKRSRSRRWIIGITLLGVLSFGFYRWAVPAPMTPNPALRTWQAGGEQWGVQWTALPGMQFIQSEGEMLGWFDNNGVPALGRNRERTPWLPPKGRYANARVADGMIYVLYWRRGAPSEMLAFEVRCWWEQHWPASVSTAPRRQRRS